MAYQWAQGLTSPNRWGQAQMDAEQKLGGGASNPGNPYAQSYGGVKGAAAMPNITGAVSKAKGTAGAAPYGTESGHTYLEDRYLNRLNGADPAFNYAMQRGGDAIDARMAAGGSYNSGARGQQLGDFAANLTAQSQAQLDALAGGATGAHQHQLDSMMSQFGALAGGQAGAGTAYDLGAAGNMSAAAQAQQQLALNKAGVDAKANQGLFSNALNLYAISKAGGGGGGGGAAANPYDPNALMPPSY